MASIVITIKTDGAAFHKGQGNKDAESLTVGREVARILHFVADNFKYSGYSLPPYDVHGNRCGKVEVID